MEYKEERISAAIEEGLWQNDPEILKKIAAEIIKSKLPFTLNYCSKGVWSEKDGFYVEILRFRPFQPGLRSINTAKSFTFNDVALQAIQQFVSCRAREFREDTNENGDPVLCSPDGDVVYSWGEPRI